METHCTPYIPPFPFLFARIARTKLHGALISVGWHKNERITYWFRLSSLNCDRHKKTQGPCHTVQLVLATVYKTMTAEHCNLVWYGYSRHVKTCNCLCSVAKSRLLNVTLLQLASIFCCCEVALRSVTGWTRWNRCRQRCRSRMEFYPGSVASNVACNSFRGGHTVQPSHCAQRCMQCCTVWPRLYILGTLLKISYWFHFYFSDIIVVCAV